MSAAWRPAADATTHPRYRGAWTIAHRDGTYSSFLPETGATNRVDPSHDGALPALAAALRRGRLIGYRVGRRAVVATRYGTFIKVVRPTRLAGLERTHELFATNSPSLSVPATVDINPLGSVELTALSGRSLHDLIRCDMLDSTTIDAVSQSLATLHTTTAAESLAGFEPDDPQRWVETVARVDNDTAGVVQNIAHRLPAISAGAGSVLHRDLHDKNVFVGANGAGFIDLDGVALGGAEHDIANLAVHLQLRALQAGRHGGLAKANSQHLYDSYAAIRPVNHELLSMIESHTWFRLGCLYLLRSRDRHIAQKILDRAGQAKT